MEKNKIKTPAEYGRWDKTCVKFTEDTNQKKTNNITELVFILDRSGSCKYRMH